MGGSAGPWGQSLGSAAGAYSVRCQHHIVPSRPALAVSQTCWESILGLKRCCCALGDSAGRSTGQAPCAARFLGLWSGCTQAGEPHAGRCWKKGGRLWLGPFARAGGAAVVDLCCCQTAGEEGPGLWRSRGPAPHAFLSSEPGRPWAPGGACGGGWRIPDGRRGAQRRHLGPVSDPWSTGGQPGVRGGAWTCCCRIRGGQRPGRRPSPARDPGDPRDGGRAQGA